MATSTNKKCSSKTGTNSVFPDYVKFKLDWRPYQARILDELKKHLQDRHFHVVAAPGSGKTVLGLEVVLRIGEPTLVLTPGLSIRDQWIQRFIDLFLPDDLQPAWVSNNLKEPGLLTVTTYQALYAYCKEELPDKDDTGKKKKRNDAPENESEEEREDGDEEDGDVDEEELEQDEKKTKKKAYKFNPEKIARKLAAAGIKNLVFDEAHHLRRQWWKIVSRFKDALKKTFIVALTATPPYDVAQLEWNRYSTICGPVDAEVHVPELVQEYNLCPHQDFIYFVKPPRDLHEAVMQFHEQIRSFLSALALDEDFILALRRHPVMLEPDNHIEDICRRNDYFLTMAIFLTHATGVPPKKMMETLGLEDLEMPPFTPRLAETLLETILFDDRRAYEKYETTIAALHNRLIAHKAIEDDKVYLQDSPYNTRLLRSSPAKLKGIVDIVELESRNNGYRLRLLILTDFIREEDFPSLEAESPPYVKLGVVPIFEKLRRLRLNQVRPGILTGSLVVIPVEAKERFEYEIKNLGLPPDTFDLQALWHDPAFLRVTSGGKGKSRIVEIMTRIFSEGTINVLVGTTALLGEGWDAPAVNTLIMATVLGTYVSSNQIRGRAIRMNPDDPDKAANIWHLACVDGEVSFSNEKSDDDRSLLYRRFRMFAGLDFVNPSIYTGIERLGFGEALFGFRFNDMDELNTRMCRLSEERGLLAKRWQEALIMPPPDRRRMTQEILFSSSPFKYYAVNSCATVMRRLFKWKSKFKLLRRYYDKKLMQMVENAAKSLIYTLQEMKLIAPLFRDSLFRDSLYYEPLLHETRINVELDGEFARVWVPGMSCRDETLFIRSFQEMFTPTTAPRYLMICSDDAVYCVPHAIGVRRKSADILQRYWSELVTPCRVHYTGNSEGKRMLLRFTQRYLISKTLLPTRTRSRWG